MRRLFLTSQFPDCWIVQTSEGPVFRVPAKLDGWEERTPAMGLNSLLLREVEVTRAFNTGIPGTSYTDEGLLKKTYLEAHPPLAPVSICPASGTKRGSRHHKTKAVEEARELLSVDETAADPAEAGMSWKSAAMRATH